MNDEYIHEKYPDENDWMIRSEYRKIRDDYSWNKALGDVWCYKNDDSTLGKLDEQAHSNVLKRII